MQQNVERLSEWASTYIQHNSLHCRPIVLHCVHCHRCSESYAQNHRHVAAESYINCDVTQTRTWRF